MVYIVNLEKGMFVEYTNPTLDHPIFKTMHHDAVNQLFKTKYGIDLKKIGFINETRLVVEKLRWTNLSSFFLGEISIWT